MIRQPVRVGIVGAGPRGLSVLERLCANAADRHVEVHIIDPYPPGAGRVWRTDQDRHLLMNTVCSQVTMFTDDTVEMLGPTRPGPSLWQWANFLTLMGSLGHHPHWVYEEARALGPDSYPTRRFFGQYLRWTFDRVVTSAPAGVRVTSHRTRAVRLDENAPRRMQRVLLADDSVVGDLDIVVLSQGHVATAPTDDERTLTRFALDHGLRYVPPVNPADVDLSGIEPGEPVMLRGLGLCFMDHLAALTVGRQGRFEQHADGLRYHASGKEPRLYAGSRRGVPYHARGDNQKGPYGRHIPTVLTMDVVDKLRAAGAERGGVDFRAEVWPLIAKEVEGVYYSTLLAERGCGCDARKFLESYQPTAWGGAEEAAVLDRFGVAPAERWDWAATGNPPLGHHFDTEPDQFRTWLLDYLRTDLAEARRGNVHSPLKAALDVLRDLRNEIRLIVDHAGLTARSHRDDLYGWYTPLNAFLSIGPPASRIAQMIALIEADVLTIVGPDVSVGMDPATARFVVESPRVPDSRVSLRTLIEARLPEPDVTRSTDALLNGLIGSGQATAYHAGGTVAGGVPTGGLWVAERPYHVLDAASQPHPRRLAFGVPTEFVHWITAAGIRPGVNSVTLADADAIAREVLSMDLRPVVQDPAGTTAGGQPT